MHIFGSEHSSPRYLPINHFFRSLAKDQRERAVGVVLSGTGSDGTLCLKEIKAALGGCGSALVTTSPRTRRARSTAGSNAA